MRGPDVASLATWVAKMRPRGPSEVARMSTDSAKAVAGTADLWLDDLDALALQRRDWHGAIAAALLQLGIDPSPWAQAVAAEFLTQATSAPLFADVAHAIVAVRPDAGLAAHADRPTSPVALARRLESLDIAALARHKVPYAMMVQRPHYRFVQFERPRDVVQVALESVQQGNPRTSPHALWQGVTLSWLAEAALWSPLVAGWMPDLAPQLWQLRELQPALLQWLTVACCKVELAPVVRATWQPDDLNREDSNLHARALAVVAEELETAPRWLAGDEG